MQVAPSCGAGTAARLPLIAPIGVLTPATINASLFAIALLLPSRNPPAILPVLGSSDDPGGSSRAPPDHHALAAVVALDTASNPFSAAAW